MSCTSGVNLEENVCGVTPSHLADLFVICILWQERPFVTPVQREVVKDLSKHLVHFCGKNRIGPARKIHCAVKKLQLGS